MIFPDGFLLDDLIVFPNANHWITNAEDSRFFYKEVQDWMKKYLGK